MGQFRLVGSSGMGDCGCQSGDGTVDTQLDESLVVGTPYYTVVPLDNDAPLVIDFTALAGFTAGGGAIVLQLRTVGAPVQVWFNQATLANQGISLDPFGVWFARTTPIAKITLTRTPATPTKVYLLAGSKP